MTKCDLNRFLVKACERRDLEEIKTFVKAGADTNQVDKYGNSIFEFVFVDNLQDTRENPKELHKTVELIKEIIPLMIDNGWDMKKFGIPTLHQFLFSTYDHITFDLYKFMLQYDLTDNPKDYEEALEGIGSEESYQRCCEENHELENLFYSIYEMVDAKMEGRSYEGIELYYNAVGLTIDKILYFNETNSLGIKSDFTEFNADIGFVCGDKLLVLKDGINILFMNDRLSETPQVNISNVFGKDVIGRKINSIYFEHKTIVKGTTRYGQPTIIIELKNGKKLKFTHNFGELPDGELQSRFWIE